MKSSQDITQISLNDAFKFAINLSAPRDSVVPPPIKWIEQNFIDPITGKYIHLEPHQKRIIRRALQMDDNGQSVYDLVVWSEPKKSGKTATAAAVGTYVACNLESPNEVATVANDKEQSAGRIFAAMMPTLKNLGWFVPVSKKGERRDPIAYGDNGTVVKAITTNYEKEAGANQGISLWSELWAYKGERLTRLWEEMLPPPTRKFSMRWVESYAGFIGENLLFQGIYLSCFTDFKESNLQDRVIKLWKDLPVYEIDEHILVYWSHDHRMPWQTPKYYKQERATCRPTTFKRLHENWWVESDEQLITDEMWRNSTRYSPEREAAVYALDGSKNGDITTLVGSVFKKDIDLMHTVDVHVWEPKPVDGKIEIPYAAVERRVVDLYRAGLLIPPLYYDSYEMAYMAQRLRKLGVPCEEFNQGSMRIKADTLWLSLYKQGKIINISNSTLKQHVMSASAKGYTGNRVKLEKPMDWSKQIQVSLEGGEGIYSLESDVEMDEVRIVKPEAGTRLETERKVDLAVAQSMSAYKAFHKNSGGWGASGL